MSRWEPNAADRLQDAAFDLFESQGFDATTVAQIAGRAGLTPRTFYNHYADKREVLFNMSARYQDEVVRGIATCAPEASPLDAVVAGLRAAGELLFQPRRTSVRRRTAIVAGEPGLLERELAKRSALEAAIADALRHRGVDPDNATLTAGAGAMVQAAAMSRWLQPRERRPLGDLLEDATRRLRSAIGT